MVNYIYSLYSCLDQHNSWIGNYKLLKDESNCMSIFCRCCPDPDTIIRIDKNSARRDRNAYILRGQSKGFFCGDSLMTNFETIHGNPSTAKTTLFNNKFMMSIHGSHIHFNNPESPRCDFIIEKFEENSSPYDTIIHINSIFELEKEGWEVWFRDRDDFEKKRKKDTIIVGVAGLYNKGKTWIINNLAESNFSSGFHVHTVGLSVKYSEYENKVASYLDTAGFETPIQFYDKKNPKTSFDNKFHIQNRSSYEITEAQKLKIKDRHVTEDLLQNFILEKADIILIVVGQLAFSDQKLINRILSYYGPTGKEMFIIHNFFELHEIRHVMEMIEEDIFGAFEVKISTMEISKELSSSGFYNQELYINMAFPHVRHLVVAREGTPAGDYFNKPAFNFLRALIQSNSPREPFDIINVLTSYTQKNLHKYIETNGIDSYQIYLDEVNGITKVKCKTDDIFKLKPISFDVNGALLRPTDDSVVQYDLILADGNLIFTIDLPGIKKDAVTGKRRINYKWQRSDYTCFVFEAELEEGTALKPSDMVVSKNRRRGYIRVAPPCLDPIFEVSNKYSDIKIEEGVLTMVFPVTRKKEVQFSIEL